MGPRARALDRRRRARAAGDGGADVVAVLGWPLVPYLRGGAVYRKDEGRFVDDEGAGWFAGGGLDWRLAEHWAVGPFVSYEEASLSIPSRTWLFGVGLTYSR